MIAVECHLDEYLVSHLGISRKKIKHQRGKGKVLEFVVKNSGAIGIIDEDPESRQPSSLNDFIEEGRIGSARLMISESDRNGHLLQLAPDLENWLIERAHANGISLSNFGLPENAFALHDFQHLEKNENFRRFLEELCKKDKDISSISEWMRGIIG